jgi:hypothetical protein
MHATRILGAAIAGALLAVAPVVTADAGTAAPKQWTVTLPETAGVQALAADANHAYTAWGDPDPGHVAAFSRLNGARRWRQAGPDFADLVAVGRSVVWVSDGGTAEAERASNGAKVTSVKAPAGEGFQTIAATGTSLVALSNGPAHQVLSEYNTAGKLIGRRTTAIPASSDCQERLGGGALYALCIGNGEAWSLYRVSVTTGRTLASRAMPAGTDGGSSLAYAGGDVYVLVATGSGGSNTTPGHIVQYRGSSLKVVKRGPILNLISIAASGATVAGVVVTSKDVPTAVKLFSVATMKASSTVTLHTGGTLIDFAADATDAFLVVYPPVTKQVAEQLIGVPLG